MQVVMCPASGEEHGLINTISNSVVDDGFKSMEPKYKAMAEKERKEDARLVKVKYINSRGRHERLTKPYCKYAGDPINVWHMIPGFVYEVPMGLVKEVNNAAKIPKRSGLVSVDGQDLNALGAPLDKDQEGEQLHMLVPATF